MKHIRRVAAIVGVACCLISVYAHAAACTAYYCAGQIQMLYIGPAGVYVQLAGGLAGLTNCTPEGGLYLTVPKTHPNYNVIYAALLARQTAEKPVTLRTDDGSPNCSVAYITVP